MHEAKVQRLKQVGNLILGIFFWITASVIVALATLQVINFFRSPQTLQVSFGANGYDPFNDIFSDIEDLRKAMLLISDNVGGPVTNEEVKELKEAVSRISDSILNKPDEAITAKLLQNDQNALNARIQNVESQIVSLNGRIDNLFNLVLAAAAVLTGIQITPPLIRSWKNNGEKKDSTPTAQSK